MYQHVDEVQRGRTPNKSNIKLRNKIRKILSLDKKVRYKKIFITENEQDAYDKEKELITEIGLKNLCNLTNGGEGGGMLGKTISKNQKIQISKVHKGKKLSKETKRKISEAQIGEKGHFYGKCHSEDSKRKMSESLKGKIPWNKGIPRSEETKRKISESLKGNILWNKNKK